MERSQQRRSQKWDHMPELWDLLTVGFINASQENSLDADLSQLSRSIIKGGMPTTIVPNRI